MEEKDLEVETLYNTVTEFATNLCVDNNALAIAAVLNAVAMSIYRTTLPDEDYEKMSKLIYDLRHNVKTLHVDDTDLGGTLH